MEDRTDMRKGNDLFIVKNTLQIHWSFNLVVRKTAEELSL